jgi:CubicO group peptidase (beta-lactamase class C family)
LDADATPLNPDSTIALASAGKFICHVAALQLVESGAIGLDEPVYQHVPEMEAFPLIKPGTGDEPFSLCHPTKEITLRHLILHTSGLSDHDVSLVSKYFDSDYEILVFKEDAPFIVKNFSIPLIFEPGEGFTYGYSIHWTQMLITRLTGNFLDYMQEHIFNPLGMASSTYRPRDNPDIWNGRLRMVEREGGKLAPADDATQGLMCSISDITAILCDLISSSPTLLKQEYINLLFTGQFTPSSTALRDLRGNHDNYAFCAGIPGSVGSPLVNWSAGGLVVEEQLPVSCMPKGTVTWEGMPNVLWAMNREKGLAMFFATQLIPVGDRTSNGLATMFMRDAWNNFG